MLLIDESYPIVVFKELSVMKIPLLEFPSEVVPSAPTPMLFPAIIVLFAFAILIPSDPLAEITFPSTKSFIPSPLVPINIPSKLISIPKVEFGSATFPVALSPI